MVLLNCPFHNPKQLQSWHKCSSHSLFNKGLAYTNSSKFKGCKVCMCNQQLTKKMQELYHSGIGTFMWLVKQLCPSIANAVCKGSKVMDQAVQHHFDYFESYPFCLVFCKSETVFDLGLSETGLLSY